MESKINKTKNGSAFSCPLLMEVKTEMPNDGYMENVTNTKRDNHDNYCTTDSSQAEDAMDEFTKCLKCGKLLTSLASIGDHMQECTGHSKVDACTVNTAISENLEEAEENKFHGCSVCDLAFTSEWLLSEHTCKPVHHGQISGDIQERKLFSEIDGSGLEQDGSAFSEGSSSESAAGTRLHSCKLCRKQCSSMKKLRQHMSSHRKIKSYACTKCDRKFTYISSLQNHMFTHSKETNKCSGCSKSFHNPVKFKLHIQKNSKNNETERFVCDICGKSIKHLCGLKRHKRRSHTMHTERKEHACSECDKVFNLPNALIVHMRSHTGERPYLCTDCGKAFSDQSTLRRHVLIHSGIRQFVCKLCNKAFTQDCGLSYHMKSHKNYVDDIHRPYECTECGKKYFKLGLLKTHQKLHSANPACDDQSVSKAALKNLSCEECGKSFTTLQSLKTHVAIIHNEVKPYKCSMCEKAFAIQSHLKYHMKIHTGEKSYKCSLCDKSFVFQSQLKYHMQAHSKAFSCHICKKNYSSEQYLQNHITGHDVQPSDRKTYCEVCEKAFSSEQYLRRHKANKGH